MLFGDEFLFSYSLSDNNIDILATDLETAYLDNAATTPPCPEAIAAMANALQANWGNPSSPHAYGHRASLLLEQARENVARALKCKDEEICFTSGGTQSNNMALIGGARAMKRRGNRIVTSAIEHSSVYETVKALEKEGFETVFVRPDSFGRVKIEDIEAAVNDRTVLVSLMTVNNETGARQPVEKIRSIVKFAKSPALIHTDAVQAFGKIPLSPDLLSADLISISAHKIHGPKGVGALYVKKGVRIEPISFGGSQESKLRPGTEPLPAITGFAAAVQALPNLIGEADRQNELRSYLLKALEDFEGLKINSPEDAYPGIINISYTGYLSDHIINHLSGLGVFVSGASACSKGKKSRVLTQMRLAEDRINSAVRISFSRFTEKEDIDRLVEGLKSVRQNVQKI